MNIYNFQENHGTTYTKYLTLLILLLIGHAAAAQTTTSVDGVVVDARSGEPLPFVNVYWVGTSQGGVTDTNGHFELSNNQGLVSIAFRYVGYKSQIITLSPGKNMKNTRVKMERESYDLNEVKVTAKRTKYIRKGNPAVELMEKVIANKDVGRAEG
ncbi:MAG: carboxypeptidase-like regulatory domain-containing protein, partial [Prevotella sp.]|nr:carboxypeptidase-like regulatory domain-containing protein [Prevotella sp.]